MENYMQLYIRRLNTRQTQYIYHKHTFVVYVPLYGKACGFGATVSDTFEICRIHYHPIFAGACGVFF